MIPIITLTVKTMDMILEKHFYKLVIMMILFLMMIIVSRLPELIQAIGVLNG